MAHWPLDWCETHNDWEVTSFCDGPLGYCRSADLNTQPECKMVEEPPQEQSVMSFLDSLETVEAIGERSS